MTSSQKRPISLISTEPPIDVISAKVRCYRLPGGTSPWANAVILDPLLDVLIECDPQLVFTFMLLNWACLHVVFRNNAARKLVQASIQVWLASPTFGLHYPTPFLRIVGDDDQLLKYASTKIRGRLHFYYFKNINAIMPKLGTTAAQLLRLSRIQYDVVPAYFSVSVPKHSLAVTVNSGTGMISGLYGCLYT